MIERINIKEIAKEFEYKDNRSVKRWCRNNGVQVLSDMGSKRQYVIKEEFEIAKSKEAMRYLKIKYEEQNFTDVLKAQMKFSAEYWQATDERKRNNPAQKGNYKPLGANEKKFLSILSKIKPQSYDAPDAK